MKKKYDIELHYGWEDGDSGTYHAFLATAPEQNVDADEIGKELAKMLDIPVDSWRFNWNSMYVSLPDALIERIKKDAVEEYLESFND